VIYCHGFPGSRLEIWLAGPAIERCGVTAHLIALNRPGYGSSSFVPNYRVVDWPRDIGEAADLLGLDHFAVIGASGGAPYALACGDVLRDRVDRIAIVAGTAPIDATGMREAPGIAEIPSRRWRRTLQYRGAALAVGAGMGKGLTRRTQRSRSEADRNVMGRPEVESWFDAVLREAFASGGRAAVRDGDLYREPWGFEIGAVGTETHLFYGVADRQIPISAGRWLAHRLPNATFTEWSHGHFSWAVSDDAAQLVADLVAPAVSRRRGEDPGVP
jgi:pimeloyl-ACP methyl ester carboxylesterase